MVKKMVKLKSKTAQMKMMQTSFMLIAVTLFLVLAALFIIMVKFSDLKESKKILDETQALLLVSKIADSPELSCGNSFGLPRTNCIDMDKLMALKSRIGDYSNFWRIDGLEIKRIYPAGIEKECTTQNYPNCNKIVLITANNGTGVSNFVSLCHKELNDMPYNKCELGKVIVVYGK